MLPIESNQHRNYCELLLLKVKIANQMMLRDFSLIFHIVYKNHIW